jgi:hypothetical protein
MGGTQIPTSARFLGSMLDRITSLQNAKAPKRIRMSSGGFSRTIFWKIRSMVSSEMVKVLSMILLECGESNAIYVQLGPKRRYLSSRIGFPGPGIKVLCGIKEVEILSALSSKERLQALITVG